MSQFSRSLNNERGAAGKIFLIFFATIAILAVAGYALWQPVLMPLVGESMPVKVEEDTTFEVPAVESNMSMVVPAGWIVQRGLFNKQTAKVTTPDLVMTVEIETWKDGRGPSLAAALKEAAINFSDLSEAQAEVIAEGVLFNYATAKSDGQENIVGAIGPNEAEDTSVKASAVIIASVAEGEIERYLPTLATLLRDFEVMS